MPGGIGRPAVSSLVFSCMICSTLALASLWAARIRSSRMGYAYSAARSHAICSTRRRGGDCSRSYGPLAVHLNKPKCEDTALKP